MTNIVHLFAFNKVCGSGLKTLGLKKQFSAAVLTKTGAPLAFVEDLEIPMLKAGQVLVRLKFAGLCQSQLHETRGRRGTDKFLPHLLGHEGSGTIEAIGPKISKVKIGDDVVVGWIKGTGLEGGPKIYKSYSLGKINAGSVTTFSQYAVVSENRVYHKPVNTPFNLSVLYGCALPTGAGLVFNEMKPRRNANIGIIGLGGVGLSSLMSAKYFSPRNLIAIDIEQHKLALAESLGATSTLMSTDGNLISKVQELVEDEGLDYVIEAAGQTSTIELGFNLLKREGGELIFASHPPFGQKISLDPFELICGKKIRGSWGGGSKPDNDIKILGDLYDSGNLKLESLLSDTYQLKDINRALDDLENRRIVRALIAI